MLHGFATPEGTRLYAERFPVAKANQFYSVTNELSVSSLGLGMCRGDADDATDRAYENAALTAMRSGVNFFDTAIHDREGRSDAALGAALRVVLNSNECQRDQLVLCARAGYLTPGAIPEWLRDEDVAGGAHSLHPDFLEDQLDRTRAKLNMDTVDVLYLHNPETHLGFVSRDVFEERLQKAFERCERLARDRRIRWYGTSSWDGYREPGQLDLQRVIDLARYVGGEDHHFRFVQLPFNFGMVEAYQNRDERGVSVLKMAARAGMTVVASATLDRARFAKPLPDVISNRIPGLESAAAKAIQFTRSTPGVAVALVGMRDARHVHENLEVAGVPPLGAPDYEKLYRPVDS